MKNAVRIGTVAGIPIRVHWSFGLLVLLYVALTAGSGAAAVGAALIWLCLLFASVVFHEMAHSLEARHRGIEVRDIVLLPIGGVSEIPDLVRSPGDEFAISLVGPASSVLLAVLFGMAALATGAALWPPTIYTGSLLVQMAWVNLLLAGFNLLPALPLDGGRVLRASLARRRGDLPATELASRVGQYLAIAMFVVGFLFDIWVCLIAIFVYVGARSEAQMARLKSAFGERRVVDLAVPARPACDERTAVDDLLVASPTGMVGDVPVIGSSGYVGMAYAPDLLRAPPRATLGDVVDRAVPLLEPTMTLFPDAWEVFAKTRHPVLPVGTSGRITGMLYLQDLEGSLQRAVAARR